MQAALGFQITIGPPFHLHASRAWIPGGHQFGLFLVTRTLFVEKTCWAGNRAEIRNSLQQNTRWGAEPRKKAFSSTLFQQIQIFGKQSFQRKSSEMLRTNKIFAKGV